MIRTAFVAAAALVLAAQPAAAQVPQPGTISIEPAIVTPDLKTALAIFVDATTQALSTKGFTVLEGAGHAGLVADLRLSRTDVGTTTARVASSKSSAGPGGSQGVGGSVVIPLPTHKLANVPLQQTRLEIRILKRGEDAVLWQGAATTVRGAGTKGGDGATAATLAEAILRGYPAQSTEAISVP